MNFGFQKIDEIENLNLKFRLMIKKKIINYKNKILIE